MNLEDAIGPVVTVLFVLALVAERFAPRETQPPVRAWWLTGIAFFIVSAALNTGLPLLLPVAFIEAHSLLPGIRLGVAGGAVVGFLVWGCAYYWLHRAQHRFDTFWRLTHQMHHSPARMDVSGFAFTHPLDIVVTALASLAVNVGVLGLAPGAAALVGLHGAVAAVLQHTNVRTPRRIEWLFQRPEAHARHHEYGQHAGNYADWPVWDKLFGTYRAPAPVERYGFAAPAARRIGAMLAGVDVNRTEPLQHHE